MQKHQEQSGGTEDGKRGYEYALRSAEDRFRLLMRGMLGGRSPLAPTQSGRCEVSRFFVPENKGVVVP
jgi:hypothetical protein